MPPLRHVYVCHKCGSAGRPTCVTAVVPEDDDLVRCPCDYDNCEWTELDPALTHAVLAVIADEQMVRIRKEGL